MTDNVMTVLSAVLIAIIGSGGMTALVQHLLNKQTGSHERRCTPSHAG